MPLETTVEVLVEVPRGGFVKRDAAGVTDYVSPLPSPFNYGCVPGRIGGDGAPLDAVLLGPRRPRGTTVRAAVHATVRFLDAGQVDDKLICAHRPPTAAERALVVTFFLAYSLAKGLLNRWRGKGGRTAFLGLDPA